MELSRLCLAWQVLMPGQARRFWDCVPLAGDWQELLQAGEERLMALKLFSARQARDWSSLLSGELLEEKVRQWQRQKIFFIDFNHPLFPDLLRNISDPPLGLFFSGDASLLGQPAVAVVGSRRATAYGLYMAEKLGRELARVGITVVSGLARGIDTAAHQGALAGGGKTIAVLGCGLDVVYPRENQKLYAAIAERGVLVSEFPPGTPPQPWHFPVRNRIISGLCRAVVVVEAGEKSGAMITAYLALEQGREVMAVPGQATSKMSRGPHRLLRQGARLVEDAGDILEELGLTRLFAGGEDGHGVTLEPAEEALLALISWEPVPLDILAIKSGLPVSRVLTILSFLELKGLVRQLPGQRFCLRQI
ncbi:MAG: DNA-processing protein DprA [Bacillota bacterium]